MQDEVHRFAIQFHRSKRSARQTESELDHIPGVGPALKARLLQHFGSVRRIKAAEPAELQQLLGQKRGSALYENLHPDRPEPEKMANLRPAKPLTTLPLTHSMRVVIQRVRHASVSVGGERISAIGPGLLILLGIEEADTSDDVSWLVGKISRLRIFNDEQGVMNRAITDVGGEALVVSQFTLMASYKKATGPVTSAPPATPRPSRCMKPSAKPFQPPRAPGGHRAIWRRHAGGTA